MAGVGRLVRAGLSGGTHPSGVELLEGTVRVVVMMMVGEGGGLEDDVVELLAGRAAVRDSFVIHSTDSRSRWMTALM